MPVTMATEYMFTRCMWLVLALFLAACKGVIGKSVLGTLGGSGRDQCELAELLEVMCLDSRNHRTPLGPVQVLLAPTVL